MLHTFSIVPIIAPALCLDSLEQGAYHSINMSALLFIRDLVIATFGQMVSLFAGVFVFGLIINVLSQFTYKSLEKAFGNGGVYLAAWLGTPLHELGHALFCVIFRHKIEDIKFFKPDKVNGTLGYVYHTWNKKNPWHIMGNFFIGIGPIILGCMVLFGLFYILIPGSSQVWDVIPIQSTGLDGQSARIYLDAWSNSALAFIRLIFTTDNLVNWRFWVFLYLAVCLSANIRLSWSDFKHTVSGLGCFIIPFFLFNLIILLVSSSSEALFPLAAAWLGAVYGMLILALVMSLTGFILIYIIAAVYYRLRYRLFLRPF